MEAGGLWRSLHPADEREHTTQLTFSSQARHCRGGIRYVETTEFIIERDGPDVM